MVTDCVAFCVCTSLHLCPLCHFCFVLCLLVLSLVVSVFHAQLLFILSATTQDNGINLNSTHIHRISLVSQISTISFTFSSFNTKVFTFTLCFLSWIQILQLGWHKKAILASGFCLFMLIELSLNGKLIFCWRVVYFIRIWF